MAHFSKFSLITAWHRVEVLVETTGPAHLFIPLSILFKSKENVWLNSSSHYERLLFRKNNRFNTIILLMSCEDCTLLNWHFSQDSHQQWRLTGADRANYCHFILTRKFKIDFPENRAVFIWVYLFSSEKFTWLLRQWLPRGVNIFELNQSFLLIGKFLAIYIGLVFKK